MEPEYRVKMEIYDAKTQEGICFSDEPMFSAARREMAVQANRLVSRFDKEKVNHEATYYPKEEVEELV